MEPNHLVNSSAQENPNNTRYGQSIGTGPTLYLASHPKYPVGGVILHSPIASGLRVFDIKVTRHSVYIQI